MSKKVKQSSESVDVLIKGFQSLDQAHAFMDWYEHQGEQESGYWFEERTHENPALKMQSAVWDTEKPVEVIEKQLSFWIKVGNKASL